MRTRMLAASATALTVAALAAAPAIASTGGTVDEDNKYSSVGLIAFYAPFGDTNGRFRCSGALIDEDTLLTAAHCTSDTVGKTALTFELLVDDAPPADLPKAADPAVGYTSEEITAAGYLAGQAFTPESYSNFTDLDNWNDYGVIELDEPVEGVEPMPIADVGTLDAIPQKQLRFTEFRAVGYGTEVRTADEGPQRPTPMSYPIVRRYVDMPGQKLDTQVLQTNGNEHDPFGTGGTCFGDSGGPLLLKNAEGVEEIVGVTSYGYTSNCRYIDGYQRVEIGIAQEWLSQFVELG